MNLEELKPEKKDEESSTAEPTPETEDSLTGETNEETQPEAEPTPEAEVAPEAERTFTQSEVNDLIKNRMLRFQEALLKKYNIGSMDELESYLQKGIGYDELKTLNDGMNEKYAFLKNNVDDNRIDDVRTYFKGKGMLMSDEELAKAIQTHPEWTKKASTLQSLGAEATNPPKEDLDARASKIFGVKF